MNRLVVQKSSQSSLVQNLLVALGVRFSVLSNDGVLTGAKTATDALLLSEAEFVDLCEAARLRSAPLAEQVPGFANILVYPFSGAPDAVKALQRVVGGKISAAAMSERGETDYIVAASRSMCGPFAGLTVEGVRCGQDVALRAAELSCV